MNIQLHYLVTLCALFFLGVIITNPASTRNSHEERTCKMIKGRMDCLSRFSEYKINKNNEVQYKIN